MKRYWPLLLAAGLCAAVYVPRLGSPFAWDDKSVIAQNGVLDHPIPWSDFIKPRYYDFSGEQSWRPLATVSYVVLVRLFGKSPALLRGFHLGLHAANAFLLSLVVCALGLGEAAGIWAAALFLIDAAHVETLMCVAFNEEILVTLGLLALILAHRKRRLGLSALALTWALLSKETGVIGLPLAFLSDWLETDKPFRRWKDYAVYSGLILVYLYIHFGPMKGPASGIKPFPLDPAMRAYFGLSSLVTAVRVFLLPVDLKIEYFALPPATALGWIAWPAAAIILIAGWAWFAAKSWKKNKSLCFLLLWPLPFLALTSPALPVTVFNTRLFAERWLYLPALGAAAALAFFLQKRPRLGAAVLVFWGACGILRAADWSSEVRLWRSLLDDYPWCAKAEEGLGEALFKQGDYIRAREAFADALDLRRSRQDKVLAFYAPMSDSGFVNWESPSLHRWLGHVDYKLGDIKEADDQFSEAAALDPDDGFVYMIAAYSAAQAKDFKKAEDWLKKGLARHPDDSFLLALKRDVERRKLTLGASFD